MTQVTTVNLLSLVADGNHRKVGHVGILIRFRNGEHGKDAQ